MARCAPGQGRPARELLRHKAYGGEVHVDGGVNRETAEVAGATGVDVLVVGSALFVKGRDMAPRGPAHPGARRRGLPVRAQRRRAADPARPDGPRSPRCPSTSPSGSWSRSRPAASRWSCSAATARSTRTACATTTCSCRPRSRRTSSSTRTAPRRAIRLRRGRIVPGGGSLCPARVRALLQRTTRRARPRRRRGRRRDRPGLVVLLGVGPADDDATADALARADRRAAHLPGRRGPDEPLARRRRRRGPASSRSSRCSRTRGGVGGPGSPARRRRSWPSGSTSGSARRFAAWASTVATGRFGAEMAVELVNDGPFTIWLDTTTRAAGRT